MKVDINSLNLTGTGKERKHLGGVVEETHLNIRQDLHGETDIFHV